MKKITLILAAILLTLATKAQVNYKVTYDNPVIRPVWILNADILDMDVYLENLDGIAFNLGLWGSVEPVDRIGIDYRLRRSWLSLGALGGNAAPNFKMELGGYYSILKSVKTKSTRIILKMDDSRVYGPDVTTVTTTATFITIPAKKQTELILRGGFYHQSGTYSKDEPALGKGEEITIGKGDFAKISANGFYAGIASRTISNVFINTDKYGSQFNSIAQVIFADIIITGNNFKDYDFGTDITAQVKAARDVLPVGFRIGFTKYQIEKKKLTGKKFGLSQTYEIGYRPYQGFYAGASLSITFVKMTHKDE